MATKKKEWCKPRLASVLKWRYQLYGSQLVLAAAQEMIKAGRAAACLRQGSYIHHLAKCGKPTRDPALCLSPFKG